jgi:ketosteroid isomerase-like protein
MALTGQLFPKIMANVQASLDAALKRLGARRLQMAGPLEAATRQLFRDLDRKDVEALIKSGAKDAQGVDEISRKWLRGIDAIGGYFRETMTIVDDIQSTISDVLETEHGDIGFVTCWLEQDYTLKGKRTHVSAPTTVAFRRENGSWRLVLVHSVPIPPEET